MKSSDIRAMLHSNGIDSGALSSGKMETIAFAAIGIWELALHLAKIEELLESKPIELRPKIDDLRKRGNGVDY
jgi:hypothetical protein